MVTDTMSRMDLLLKQFRVPRTANEAIEKIYKADVKKGLEFVNKNRSWKFYVHLNKVVAPLAKQGLIVQVDTKVGPSKRKEKVWVSAKVKNKK